MAEESLKAARRQHEEKPTNAWIDSPLSMRDATRREDPFAGLEVVLLLSHPDHVLPLDDVEVLVLVRVDVGGGIEERRQLLDHREGTASHLSRCADGDGQPSEPEDFAS